MNNKGQSLVTFIIILPIIIILCGMIIELSNISYNKHRVLSVTKTIISNVMLSDKTIDNNEKDDIIKLYNDNNIQIDDLNVIIDDNIRIKGTFKIKSFMGKIIGKDFYKYKVDIKGVKEEDKIKFIKG